MIVNKLLAQESIARACNIISTSIDRKIEELKNKRFDNSVSYTNFLKFACDVGRLNIPYEFFISDNKLSLLGEFIKKDSTIQRIFSFTEMELIFGLQKLYSEKKSLYEYELVLGMGFWDYFKSLNPSKSSATSNMILNFLLIVQIENSSDLTDDQCIELFNYFFSVKNINQTRRDFCLLIIVEYCINNDKELFFKLRKQYYNHVSNIFSRLVYNNIITNSERKLFISFFFNAIRKHNSFKITRKRRVAICISGQYRSNTASLESIKKNLVTPLNADVFIHTWDSYSKWTGFGGAPQAARTLGKDIGLAIPKEYSDLRLLENVFPTAYPILKEPIWGLGLNKDVFDLLNPKIVQIENEEDYVKSLGEDISGYLKPRGSLNQIKMFYGIGKSIDMALSYDKYDYIIRCRPDSLINESVSMDVISNLENNTIYCPIHKTVSLQDYHFCISSSMAYNFSQFIGCLFEKKQMSPYDEFPLYDAHNLMMAWMVSNNYICEKEIVKGVLLPNQKITLPRLKLALKSDFSKLTLDDQNKFREFVNILIKRNG